MLFSTKEKPNAPAREAQECYWNGKNGSSPAQSLAEKLVKQFEYEQAVEKT